LWDGENVVAEGGVIDFVGGDTESGGFIARILLELRLDIDDERGGDGGGQTSL